MTWTRPTCAIFTTIPRTILLQPFYAQIDSSLLLSLHAHYPHDDYHLQHFLLFEESVLAPRIVPTINTIVRYYHSLPFGTYLTPTCTRRYTGLGFQASRFGALLFFTLERTRYFFVVVFGWRSCFERLNSRLYILFPLTF